MPDFRRFTSSRPTSEFMNYQRYGLGDAPADGLTPATAARSALELMQNGQTSNGLYWINPGGLYTDVPLQIYCDLNYDEGGWMLVFSYYKGQTPVANANNYYTSPQAAATGTSQSISVVARPTDPLQSYCLPDNFWKMSGSDQNGRGEVREEYAISGGTWPNNSTRVVTYLGGRTSGGLAGNFLTSSLMSQTRSVFGYNGRAATQYGYAGSIARGGYVSNTLGLPTRYSSTSTTNTVLGISVDASNLNTGRGGDGTNNNSATSSSWVGRGSGYSNAGSSVNGGSPNGTRWALAFIR